MFFLLPNKDDDRRSGQQPQQPLFFGNTFHVLRCPKSFRDRIKINDGSLTIVVAENKSFGCREMFNIHFNVGRFSYLILTLFCLAAGVLCDTLLRRYLTSGSEAASDFPQ